jgi:hypothetical protein
MKCVITEILETTKMSLFSDYWKVKFKYKKGNKLLEKIVYFDYLEEVELYKVSFEFEEE